MTQQPRTPTTRLARSLRRKARAALTTYAGRHWPDARQIDHDGIAVHVAESGKAGKIMASYLAALDPEVIIATLDELGEPK